MDWVPSRIIVRAPAGEIAEGDEFLLIIRPATAPGVPFNQEQARELREAYVAADIIDF